VQTLQTPTEGRQVFSYYTLTTCGTAAWARRTAAVRRAAIGRYRLPAMPASANLQAAAVGLLLWAHGGTDGRTPDKCMDL